MKKKLTAFVLALCLVLVLAGCNSNPIVANADYQTHSFLINIQSRDCLYYDPSTSIVYFLLSEHNNSKRGFGYMSPYYAPNGLPYLYDVESGELVEIER